VRVFTTDTTLMWGPPYYTKLAMACAGGRGPDLASMHASRLATFSANLLDEWDLGELAARGVTLDQFPRPVLDRVLIGGRLMALPLDTHPLVLYYNTEICRRAGLLAADGTLAPIRGAEQMLDAGRRAARVTGAMGIAMASFDALANWMVFWAKPILQYVYETGFVDYRLGYASAISYLFFLLIVVFALIQARLATRRSG
jgi:multiple sugar transport system substrate-binding protein